MAAPIKMDELLVSWLGSDDVYENVLELIEKYDEEGKAAAAVASAVEDSSYSSNPAVASNTHNSESNNNNNNINNKEATATGKSNATATGNPKATANANAKQLLLQQQQQQQQQQQKPHAPIPPFYPLQTSHGIPLQRRRKLPRQFETWDPLPDPKKDNNNNNNNNDGDGKQQQQQQKAKTATATATARSGIDGATTTTSTTPGDAGDNNDNNNNKDQSANDDPVQNLCVRDQIQNLLIELQILPAATGTTAASKSKSNSNSNNSNKSKSSATSKQHPDLDSVAIPLDVFVRITKEICRFPSFFNGPLYHRILHLWNNNNNNNDHHQNNEHGATTNAKNTNAKSNSNSNSNNSGSSSSSATGTATAVTVAMLEWYWKREMEPFDASERFFRLVKQPTEDCIVRDDFLPYIKALLNDHPGLEFLSNHAEFQEKYAVTVITRIFYSVNKCHSGRITARQVRRSDLPESFLRVDEEEDINKVTRYFSYEHFYVLYCRFWELDHDRDYRITRQDLLKYGDCSLSHMIVDRIFDSAPRPFARHSNNNGNNGINGSDQGPSSNANTTGTVDREHLSYEEFIYFMLSEEDKSNEVSVRYWFNCVDVDGDGKLNNMEMRSFYAVQLHRMQCMGHEIVPFEDMLCQMMDMIKPKHSDYLIVEDFLQPECASVSGALFDALFNLNKYLLFEQRDPFVERQKREDEFETDWDRFACIDYNRLAMEEEAREEEAMEIDWVTVDEDDDDDSNNNNLHHHNNNNNNSHHQNNNNSHHQNQKHNHGGSEFHGGVTSEAPF